MSETDERNRQEMERVRALREPREWVVEIEWNGGWYPLPTIYSKRDDAEWDIAKWRQAHGGNGRDTGLRARPVSSPNLAESGGCMRGGNHGASA